MISEAIIIIQLILSLGWPVVIALFIAFQLGRHLADFVFNYFDRREK